MVMQNDLSNCPPPYLSRQKTSWSTFAAPKLPNDAGKASARNVGDERWNRNLYGDESERIGNAPRAKLLQEDAFIYLVCWHAFDKFTNLRLRRAGNTQSEERPQRLAAIFPVGCRKIHDRLDLALLAELVGLGKYPFPLFRPQRADHQRSKDNLECKLLVRRQGLHAT